MQILLWSEAKSRFVLGLYRKREWARSAQWHVVYARFR